MATATDSGPAQDACAKILLDLQSRAYSAQQAWLAAKATTAQALVNERAALESFRATTNMFNDASITLARAYGFNGALACPRPPGSPASASSLTSDVLSEIFEHMMQPYEYGQFGSTEINHPAFVVASVSLHWRSVALATHSIWTRVRLSFSPTMWTYANEYLALSLARSGGLPLNLFVCFMETEGPWPPMGEQVVAHILSRCATIQVEIANDHVPFKTSILPRLQADMPKLRDFRFIAVAFARLDLGGVADVREIPPGTRLLTLSPDLRSLDMATMPFQLIDPTSLPNMSNFTISAPISSEQLGEIARAWKGLKSLDIGDVRGETPFIHNAVPFARLESLTIPSGTHNLLRLVSHRDMPVLRELFLACANDVQHGFFVNFLQPGPCASLRALTLTGKFARMFPNTFTLLPALETLCVRGLESKPTRGFFKLWYSSTLVAHPPRLARLLLENCAFSVGDAAMLDFLTRRQAGSAKLRGLHIVQNMLFEASDDIFAFGSLLKTSRSTRPNRPIYSPRITLEMKRGKTNGPSLLTALQRSFPVLRL